MAASRRDIIKQLFAEGQEFTYDLNDIDTYYKTYVELMDHWDKTLPEFILRIQHEDVVEVHVAAEPRLGTDGVGRAARVEAAAKMLLSKS